MRPTSKPTGLIRIIRGAFTFAVIVAMSAPQAFAQMETTVRQEQSPIKQWIAVVVFSGLSVAIAFKNPKRSHQG